MKKGILLLTSLVLSFLSFAQNIAINNNGANADPSAMLDVQSTTKGMLVPRMTTAQRTAIASPVKGLLVFDNDTNSFWFYNGTAWNNLASPFTLPYTDEATSVVPTFSIKNNGSGAGIRGIGVSGPGLYGYANGAGLAGVAVKAENTHANGIGFWSYTSSGDANTVISNSGAGDLIRGFSGVSAGNLVYRVDNIGNIITTGKMNIGSSSTPTARLEVNGNIKIADGTQGAGKQLTSDASGNAMWTAPIGSMAFRAHNFSPQTFVPFNAYTQLSTTLEDYDPNLNFFSSAFTAPATGIYHFDAKANIAIAAFNNINYTYLTLMLYKNGVKAEENFFRMTANNITFNQTLTLNTDMYLAAGDVITLYYVGSASEGSGPADLDNIVFSGFRIY